MKLKFREGVFVVVYRLIGKTIFYLALRRKLHWCGWEFPKGGIEKREKIRETIKREIREETGLRAVKIIDMKIKGRYRYKKMLKDRPGIKGMSWHLFAVEAGCGKIKLDKKEHSGYIWKSYNQAIKMLTYPNQRKCLRFVNKFINSGI